MTTAFTGRRGFALAAALLAAVLIAALLAAMFFAVNEETRSGAALAWRDAALSTAESELEATLARLRAQPPAPLPAGSVESMTAESGNDGVRVHRISLGGGVIWLVAAVATSTDPGGPPRRIGLLVREVRVSADSISIVRVRGRGWSELF